MPINELRSQIAAELAAHFPVNSVPGVVICRCGTRVSADADRLAFREHLADEVLVLVETATNEAVR